jgi:HK97 family phage portal protein
MLRFAVDRQIETSKKSVGLSQFAKLWLSGGDVSDDSQRSRPSEAYRQVALIFTCVNELIKGVQSLPLVLSTVDEKIIESGPVYDLLFNSPTSWHNFVLQTIGHFSLTRDVFWAFFDSNGNPTPGGALSQVSEIVVISGSQMHPLTSNGQPSSDLVGWEFRGRFGERERFAASEVYQWKGFNPYDKFHGISTLAAAANEINYGFAASLYNASALANGAEPGIILTMPGNPGDEEIRLFHEQFDNRHRGACNAKKTALITGGADVKTVAQTLADLEVAQITEYSDKKICSAFGVPPGVAGLITEAQYAHGPANRQFIFNTIIPLASTFAEAITHGIISRFTASKSLGDNFPAVPVSDARFFTGTSSLNRNRFYRDSRHKAISSTSQVFAWLDSSQHPVVQEAMREMAVQVLKFTESGVKLNNLIESHDLPYEQVPWGEHWWVGMGQVPADYILEAGLEGITGPPYPGEQPPEEPEETEEPGKAIDRPVDRVVDNATDKAADPHKLRIWNNWVISWAGIEREYTIAMRIFFVRQQRVLIRKLEMIYEEGKAVLKATPDEVLARVVLDLKIQDGKLRSINQSFFMKSGELGIRQALSEILGLKGKDLAEKVQQVKNIPWFKGKLLVSTQKISGVNKITQKLVARQLKQGLEAGEGLDKLAGRIKDVLGSNRARAQTIARTQTSGAVGTGRHSGMKAAGVDLKGWLTAGDEHVRKSHADAGDKYADGIPLDIPFTVGGENLMYPGDPSGSPANIINCRCAEIARRAAGKEFGLEFYANLKFYSYENLTADAAA